MTKISKTIKCLLLGGLLLCASYQKAEAFIFPPMPGEPSFDGVNNAGKVVTVLQEGYHTGKSILSGDYAAGLVGVKGLMNDFPFTPKKKNEKEKQASKAPGSLIVPANSHLNISKDSTDEGEFYNAFQTLFFTYDFSNKGEAKEGEFRTLYRRKAVEFKQDMAVNTYITAKVMEDYLEKIDAALTRLEKCQNGELSGEKDCTFFGLTMEEVEATQESFSTEEGGDENNKAQVGAARNAYIVTTVQDRLLRIVEELTALEAIFQASRQIDIAKPVDVNQQQSDAEKYNKKTYDFAYSDTYTYAAAKNEPLVRFNDRIKMCDGKSNDPRCPAVNEDKAEIKVLADTAVLAALPTIEEYVNNAVAIHNLKSMMYKYKTQYRQYLLQKEIHSNAKKLVENSDSCVVNFLSRHSAADEKLVNALQLWYGGREPSGNERFDYTNRKGLSGDLITKYDEISADITIGSSNDCRGYYEENACPAGYKRNTKKCCEKDKSLCACEIELVTEDLSDVNERTKLDSNPTGGAEAAKISKDRDDTDGFIDSTSAEKIEKESRNSIELTWNLGREALLNAMKDSKNGLKFSPWNDQKVLQEEYLRNKYRNIKLIIESVDQGITAYKLASGRAGGYKNSADPITPYIKAAMLCMGKADAETAAKEKHCTGSYVSCTATYNAGSVTTEITRKIGIDSHGKPIYKTEKYTDSQQASLNDGCTYKKSSLSGMNISSPSVCLTPQCLVNSYFTKRWPAGADGFYNEAHNKGRVVAQDKMAAVMTERQTQEQNVHDLISNYQTKITNQDEKVHRAIGNLETTNKSISTLKNKKNIAADEQRKTDKRISAITDEINGLKKRKDNLLNKTDKDIIEDKITKLGIEQKCLEGSDTGKKGACEAYIIDLKYDEKFVERTDHTYVPLPQITKDLKSLTKQVEAQEDRLTELKDTVQKERDKLEDLKTEFAEKYLEAEEKAQKAIENKNLEYERFLDPSMDDGYSTYSNNKTYRMRNSKNTNECYSRGLFNICTKRGIERIKEDNLKTSIDKFIRGGDLKAAMEKELNATFFASMTNISNMLTHLGIPSNFYVDETFSAIGLSSGAVTAVKLAEKAKDKVVEIAAEELKNIIEQADKDTQKAVDDAAERVKKFASENKVDGESNQMPSETYLMSPAPKHKSLIDDLRTISNRFSGENIQNLFGIPDKEITAKSDDSYFVALPARSNNYSNKQAADTNAGRDFVAPKEMLSSLPPLREVFYFNAADYEDFPRDGKGRPVLTELLLCKNYNETKGVCETEYLPEVWLHLLARPNLRDDHKYWQTFVERSFGGNKQLNDLVQNQIANGHIYPKPKDSDYRAIIARAGVYPCKVAEGIYIDITGGDNVSNIRFRTRNSLPSGVTAVACQEVSLSGNKIIHKLADKKLNTENLNGTTTEPMYEKHSELGQLLTKDLKYRPLQENIQKFLLKNENKNNSPENNIERQKAERASFKRNVMGSFLDAVTTEYNARKSLEQSKKIAAETLQNLCKQIDSLNLKDKPTINGCKDLLNTEDISAIADIEKSTVVDKMKLADSYDTDNKYYDGDGNYKGIDCTKTGGNIYKQIFCILDAEKNFYVSNAQTKMKNIKFNENVNGADYIKERLDKINGYIGNNGSLIIDNDEVTTVRPGVTPNVETSHADRDVEIQTAEEGLEAMANQSQAVAYCPIY